MNLQNGFNKPRAENLKLTLDTYASLVTGGNGKLLGLFMESNPNEMKEIANSMKEIILKKR